jgi:hypothetical protein
LLRYWAVQVRDHDVVRVARLGGRAQAEQVGFGRHGVPEAQVEVAGSLVGLVDTEQNLSVAAGAQAPLGLQEQRGAYATVPLRGSDVQVLDDRYASQMPAHLRLGGEVPRDEDRAHRPAVLDGEKDLAHVLLLNRLYVEEERSMFGAQSLGDGIEVAGFRGADVHCRHGCARSAEHRDEDGTDQRDKGKRQQNDHAKGGKQHPGHLPYGHQDAARPADREAEQHDRDHDRDGAHDVGR